VGIFWVRHGVRSFQGVGSRSRFNSTSNGRPQCASRGEAASSMLACSESRPRKAVCKTSAHRTQALASAAAINNNGARDFGPASMSLAESKHKPRGAGGTELFSCFTDGITVSLLTSPRVGCDVAYWPIATYCAPRRFGRERGEADIGYRP
jgi:hypothetical protein